MGKKIGIVAFVCAVLFIVCVFIAIAQKPQIPDEVYDLMAIDQETAMEQYSEYVQNASTLFKIADNAIGILGLAGIVTSIVALVKMVKAKEKGKVFPILAMVLIVVFFFVYSFSIVDFGKAVQAGIKAGMEMSK